MRGQSRESDFLLGFLREAPAARERTGGDPRKEQPSNDTQIYLVLVSTQLAPVYTGRCTQIHRLN